MKSSLFRIDQFTNRNPAIKWSHKAGTLVLLFGTLFASVGRGDNSSLAGAVEARDSARTAILLSSQIDVNIPQVDGMTALHWAAHHDDWELGKRLLDLGANASAQNIQVDTNLPIIVAGGAAGGMKGNRHLRYDKPTPLANLHLSLLDKVGVHLDKFGDSNGKIDNLFGPLSF